MLYAVLYVRGSCFVVRGCAVSTSYIRFCNCDMFSVVNVYPDHLKFCVVFTNGRNMWSKYVVEICGRNMWSKYVVEICGRNMWSKYVVEIWCSECNVVSNECNVVSNECNEPTHALCNISVRTVVSYVLCVFVL